MAKGQYSNQRFKIEKHASRILPYETTSICPDCYFLEKKINIIPANLVEKEDNVFMFKKCETHGEFTDILWTDKTLWVE